MESSGYEGFDKAPRYHLVTRGIADTVFLSFLCTALPIGMIRRKGVLLWTLRRISHKRELLSSYVIEDECSYCRTNKYQRLLSMNKNVVDAGLF